MGVDSTTSFLVTSRGDIFTSNTAGDYGNVRMENDGEAKIVGIGGIYSETNMQSMLVLRNVRHVPNICL